MYQKWIMGCILGLLTLTACYDSSENQNIENISSEVVAETYNQLTEDITFNETLSETEIISKDSESNENSILSSDEIEMVEKQFSNILEYWMERSKLTGIEEHKVIPEKIIDVELENYGSSKLVPVVAAMPSVAIAKLSFCLVDSENTILYQFPCDNEYITWIFCEIHEIKLYDVNEDGKQDIIVLADHMVGQGPTVAQLFDVATIYFQHDMEFISLPEFGNNIHNIAFPNKTMEMVLEYAKQNQENIAVELESMITDGIEEKYTK